MATEPPPSAAPSPAPSGPRPRRFRLARGLLIAAIAMAAAELLARLVTLWSFHAPLMRHPEIRSRFEATAAWAQPMDLSTVADEEAPEETPWVAFDRSVDPPRQVWKAVREATTSDFRSWPAEPAVPPGVVRVAFVGNSTTFEGYPEAAGRRFDEALGPGRVEVVNMSLNGGSAAGCLYLAGKFLPSIRPHIAVFYFGFNEIGGYEFARREDEMAAALAARTGGALPSLDATELCRLYPSRGFVHVVADALGLSGLPPPCRDRFRGRDEPPLTCEGSRVCEHWDAIRDLRGLVEQARGIGARPYLSTFAAPDYDRLPPDELDFFDTDIEYLWPPLGDTARYGRQLAELNRRIRALADETGTPLVDVAAGMKGGRDLFTDNCHRTRAGLELHGRIAADALLPAVRELLGRL